MIARLVAVREILGFLPASWHLELALADLAQDNLMGIAPSVNPVLDVVTFADSRLPDFAQPVCSSTDYSS